MSTTGSLRLNVENGDVKLTLNKTVYFNVRGINLYTVKFQFFHTFSESEFRCILNSSDI